MAKIIRLETCGACQYRQHRGGFAKIAYVPFCYRTGEDLPYRLGRLGGLVSAEPTYRIPESCPLEDAPEATPKEG